MTFTEAINIESGTQTFEKLQALTEHLQLVLEEADQLIRDDLDLRSTQFASTESDAAIQRESQFDSFLVTYCCHRSAHAQKSYQ